MYVSFLCTFDVRLNSLVYYLRCVSLCDVYLSTPVTTQITLILCNMSLVCTLQCVFKHVNTSMVFPVLMCMHVLELDVWSHFLPHMSRVILLLHCYYRYAVLKYHTAHITLQVPVYLSRYVAVTLVFRKTQIPHFYYLSPLCVLRCCRRLKVRVNPLPQTSHLCGFSPVCVKTCRCRIDRCINPLPQTSHLYGFSPVCVLK